MATVRASLTQELRNAGITRAAIDAVWPEWWSAGAENSVSATTELRYTLARRLGLSPRSLFGDEPRFVWRDSAKFKNLGDTTPQQQAILESFGIAVGRALISAAAAEAVVSFSAEALRAAVLESKPSVDLRDILGICWSLGIPVIKANLLPLRHKYMQAMSVSLKGRYAILIGRTTRFPAWAAFVIAHELGHIFGGHLADGSALLEMADPLQSVGRDDEEVAADKFALTLLTGDPNFQAAAGEERYNSAQVVDAVVRTAPQLGIDPGVLALCLAHSTGRWAQTMKALKDLPDQYLNEDVGIGINWLASQRIDWDALPDDRAAHIRAVMGPDSAG